MASPSSPSAIGSIVSLSGDTVIQNSLGQQWVAAHGDEIHLHDRIITAPNASVDIEFIDGARFAIAPNSEMTITKLIFDPDATDNGLLIEFFKGAFEFVAGAVAPLFGDGMQVATPVGTLGVRGTAAAGHQDPVSGAWSFLLLEDPGGHVGKVVLVNSAGRVLLDQGLEVTRIIDSGTPPSDPVSLTPGQVRDIFGAAIGLIDEIEQQLEGGAGDQGSNIPAGDPAPTNGGGLSHTPNIVHAALSGGEPLGTTYTSRANEAETAAVGALPEADVRPEVSVLDQLTEALAGEQTYLAPPIPAYFVPVPPPEGYDNYIDGTRGPDAIQGTMGDDWAMGYEGDDTLQGSDGDDVLTGGPGLDQYDGGAGYDFARFNHGNEANGIIVDMRIGAILDDGYGNRETSLVGIEGILGSRLNDNMIAGSGIYDYRGRDGDDTLSSGTAGLTNETMAYLFGDDGDDLLVAERGSFAYLSGGTGDDRFIVRDNSTAGGYAFIVGDAGHDTYAIDSSAALILDWFFTEGAHGIDIDLSTGTIADDGFGNTETFSGIVVEVLGSQDGDTIVGSSWIDFLVGASGNDVIADGGADSTDGNPTTAFDHEALFGDDGDDRISTGCGNGTSIGDQIDGGAGHDAWIICDSRPIAIDLQFPHYDDEQPFHVERIEEIHLESSRGSSITLRVQDVLNISDDDTLFVSGNASNSLQSIGEGWILTGSDGGINRYTAGGATLYVETDLVQNIS